MKLFVVFLIILDAVIFIESKSVSKNARKLNKTIIKPSIEEKNLDDALKLLENQSKQIVDYLTIGSGKGKAFEW